MARPALTPDAVLARFPASARLLTAYAGRTRLGCVVDLDGRHEVHAFDQENRPLGTFASRKVAFDAVSARYEHERGGR